MYLKRGRKFRNNTDLAQFYDLHDASSALAEAHPELPDKMILRKVTYALRMPQASLDELRRAAEQKGVRVSALMRAWLMDRLANKGKDPSPGQQIDVDGLLEYIAGQSRGSASAVAKCQRSV